MESWACGVLYDNADEVKRLTAERDRERERAETERGKAQRAIADAEVARQSAREARQADEVRLALLVDTPGISYLRTTRGNTPVVYGADEAFTIGERWRLRMLQDGWRQVVPTTPARDRDASPC